MRPTPFRVPLLALAEHDAEADAGFAVALVAELMESDQFRLMVLSLGSDAIGRMAAAATAKVAADNNNLERMTP